MNEGSLCSGQYDKEVREGEAMDSGVREDRSGCRRCQCQRDQFFGQRSSRKPITFCCLRMVFWSIGIGTLGFFHYFSKNHQSNSKNSNNFLPNFANTLNQYYNGNGLQMGIILQFNSQHTKMAELGAIRKEWR